jgi:hypothetical protein
MPHLPWQRIADGIVLLWAARKKQILLVSMKINGNATVAVCVLLGGTYNFAETHGEGRSRKLAEVGQRTDG